MGGLSWWHWLIIGAAFILLFGAKKLPDAARGLGRSLRILKSEVGAMSDDDTKSDSAIGETKVAAPVVIPTPALVAAAPVQATSSDAAELVVPVPVVPVPVVPVPVVAVPVR
jgi:sec-independent protein translocase protein TatA